MRRGLWAAAILVLALVPVSGRAAVRPLVRFAHGTATIRDYNGDGGEWQFFAMAGSFRLGRSLYKGTVTGSWFSDGYSNSFSGSDAGHAFNASCEPARPPLTGYAVIGGSPGPALESLACQASIDGSRPALLILVFVLTTEQQIPCSRCNAQELTGYFVGL